MLTGVEHKMLLCLFAVLPLVRLKDPHISGASTFRSIVVDSTLGSRSADSSLILLVPTQSSSSRLSELRALKGNVIRRAASAGGTDRDCRAGGGGLGRTFGGRKERMGMHESIMHVEGLDTIYK